MSLYRKLPEATAKPIRKKLWLSLEPLSLVLCCLLGGGQFNPAEAAGATGTNAQVFGTNTIASGANSIAAGDSTQATGNESIAASTHNVASGSSSIALGGTYNQAKVKKSGTYYLVYTKDNVQYYKKDNSYYTVDGDTLNTDTTDTDYTAVWVDHHNEASGVASVAFGENTRAVGQGSIAFGLNTQAGDKNGGQDSVAFGEDTKALGGRSLAFGEKTVAKYNDSVAFGNDTRASSTGATAFGNRTRALAQYSTAWGNATVAADEESTAWGTDTIAGAKLDTNGALTNNYTENGTKKTEKMDAHGNLAYVKNGTTYGIKQMAIDTSSEKHDYVVLSGQDGNKYVRDYQGSLWKVNVDEASGAVTVDTTVGTKGKVYNGRNQTSLANTTINGSSVAITPDSVLNKAHEGTNGYDIEGYTNATAFGYSTEASGDNATAWGNDTAATTAGATAFGDGTTASGVNATAWGESSTASGEAATAFGIGSTASGKNSLAGLGGTAANENSIALGKDTKANNTTENAVSVAIGQNAEASGARSLAIGFGVSEKVGTKEDTTLTQTTASGESAIAIGTDTASAGQHSTAIGSHTSAVKDSSVAIGYDTHAVNDSTVAIGSGTYARGRYSVAMGLSSVAGTETNNAADPLDGGGSVAIGYAASAEASRSVAIGTASTATDSTFTTALGDSTKAQTEGSVALGAGSIATRAAGNKERQVTRDTSTYQDVVTYSDEKKAYLKPDNFSNLSATDQATWVSTTGAVSVGGNTKYKTYSYDSNGNQIVTTNEKYLTRQITDVAAGSDDTDAVNVAQLKAAGVTVTSKDNSVGIEKTTDTTDYHTNYDLKVATATLNQETTGTGDSAVPTGKITVTNPTISKTENGTTTTVENKNAYVTGDSVANAINNSGFNLTTSASTGGTASGTTTELINPGETVTLDAGKNIAITQAQNKITVATKDDLAVNSITYTTVDANDSTKTYTTKIDGKGIDITPSETDSTKKITLTQDGLSNGGKKITNVGSGLGDTKDISTITDSATLQNAVNVGDLQKVAAAHTAVTVNGSIEAPTVEANNTLGSYTGTDKGNLLLAQKKAENGKVTYDLKLNDTLNLGKANSKSGDQTVAGVDGSINVTGKTGASVNINGADGTMGLKGADGANALTVKSNNDASKVGVDGDKGTTRLSYDTKTTVDGTTTTTTHNLATMDDGQKYAGDVQATDAKSNVFGRKINEQTNVVGGVTTLADLSTANNVGVVSNGTDTLTIRLAKKLSGLTSVMTETKDAQGNVTNTTVQNGDGITITPQGKTEAKDKISLTTNGLSNGGKQITYVDSGLKDSSGTTVTLANASGDVLNNAVNVGDLKDVVSDVNSKHTKVTVEGGIDAGTTDYSGKNLKLKSTTKDNQTTYDLKLADNLTLGSETTKDTTGKETIGVDGSLTVKGKDGSSVALNGADGSIGLTGPKGADGQDGISIKISTVVSTATLNDNQNIVTKDGNGNVTKTEAPRIQYQYKDGDTTKTYEAATMDDGLKFAGDDSSKTVAKKLNETLQIRGDGTYDTATQKNNGNIVTSVDGDGIKVALSNNINLHKMVP